MPTVERPTSNDLRTLLREDVGLSTEITDEMAIPSHTHWNPLIRWLFWKRYVELSDLARFRSDMSVLDFGCGIGVFLPTLCRNAATVYATDLFPQYARRFANQKNLDVTFVESLDAIEPQSLDLIVAADVLEHITDLADLLTTFKTLLKAGGRLAISGPTENLVYKLGRVAAGFAGKGDYHVTNIAELERNILGNGFKLLARRNLPFAVPPHLFRVLEFECR